jgi:hypothetical protein
MSRAVAPGLTLRHVARPEGPWALHVLAVDLRAPGLRVDGMHALDAVAGRERTSAAAARWCAPEGRGERRAVAAVNGDLFDLATGASEGSQVVGGVVLKGVARTDSPFDTFDNTHSQLAVASDGTARIGRWSFAGTLVAGDTRLPLDGVNAPRAQGREAALFTPAAGARTPSDSTRRDVVELPYEVRNLPRGATWRDWPRAGDTLRLRRSGTATTGGDTPIPERGVVLAAREGTPAAALLAPGGPRELEAVLAFAPDPGAAPLPTPLHTLLGGWGRLVAGGEVVAARADSLEGTFPRFSAARHPRTAVGLTRGGDTLLLVVVDGRSARSVGMTFAELGTAMRSLGAWDAVNLDGGGSSAMVVHDTVVNVPSDSAGERTVGNLLLVTRPIGGARRCPAPLPRPTETPRYDRRDPDARPARRPG